MTDIADAFRHYSTNVICFLLIFNALCCKIKKIGFDTVIVYYYSVKSFS